MVADRTWHMRVTKRRIRLLSITMLITCLHQHALLSILQSMRCFPSQSNVLTPLLCSVDVPIIVVMVWRDLVHNYRFLVENLQVGVALL